MGKTLCKNHGPQVAAFVSAFHQDKIAKAESSQEHEIRYIEVKGIKHTKHGRYLVDPDVLAKLELAEEGVSSIHFSSSSFEKLALELKAVCPICLVDYLEAGRGQ